MASKCLITLLFLLLINRPDALVESSSTSGSSSSSSVDNDLNEIISAHENIELKEKPYVRERRLANPLGGIFSFFATLGNIKQIFNEVRICLKILLCN